MKNRKLILIVSLVLALTMSLGGTLAYLTDTDSEVNTMVLGNVDIEQHEYQRAKNEDGSFKKGTVEEQASYVLEDFDQNKPLLPTTEVDENGKPVNWGAGNWDETTVLMSQVDSYGDMKVFKSPLAVDKFVTVENTGKTAAYVRTFIAFESGAKDYDAWEDLVGINCNLKVWKMTEIGIVEINGNNYNVKEFVYLGSEGVRHENGILPAGETTYPSLSQIYLDSRADNEDMVEFDGNANGTFDILVLSQAIQKDGFESAAAAFKAGFDNNADAPTKELIQSWFEGEESTSKLPVVSNPGTDEDLKDDLTGNEKTILVNLTNDVTYDVAAWDNNAMGGEKTELIIINGNGHTITFNNTNSDWNNIVTGDAVLKIKNATVNNYGHDATSGTWNAHDIVFQNKVVFENVVFENAICLEDDATLTNVTLTDDSTGDAYGMWIRPTGQTIIIDGLTMDMTTTDGTDRGIKIDDQYMGNAITNPISGRANAEKPTLIVKNATFKTEKKAAILVKTVAGADITLSNVDISGVAADSTNPVWVDAGAAAYADLVTVTGGSKIIEGQ